MKAKNLFRITFYDKNEKVIFTTKVFCASMRGAKIKAQNLEPFEWHKKTIKDLSFERNLFLDNIEFSN
jgi:hypothetical protein